MPHLWFAYPDDLCCTQTAEACAHLLSEDEHTRLQSFRFDRDRRQYLTTRVLVRTALAHHLQAAPESLVFSSNPWGKPQLPPEAGLRFNISNCPALVVCLVADQMEIGVDMEPFERAAAVAGLGSHIFSLAEQRQLDALPDQLKLDRALILWTLKESWIKARGMGLSIPPDKISFFFSDSGTNIRLKVEDQFREDASRNWQCCLLNHSGHRVALMIDSSAPPRIERWDLHPILSPPQCLSHREDVWYSLTES